jgi:NDP-4-keto-2,6-dideoxyhexose 3-C-methyltransferase
MNRPVSACRICGNTDLVEVLNLGDQAMTGVFPWTPDEHVASAPLVLVKCHGPGETCGLVQLAHTCDPSLMYGSNYGYRSGLNASMVAHLRSKVRAILARVDVPAGSLVIDIGSNDGTTLAAYPEGRFQLVGIDPTGDKFRQHYRADARLIADFFSARAVRAEVGEDRASIITSFSMLYDLDRPLDFVTEVASVLHPDGVWIFEQSYLPTMLARNSYDTVCHEHLEYYSLQQIRWMLEQARLEIVDVEFNDVNGGSFSVVAAHSGSAHRSAANVAAIMAAERRLDLEALQTYEAFAGRVAKSRDALHRFLEAARRDLKTVAGLGASTKGNVLLQYCGLSTTHLSCVGEVNEEKFGRYTPGSLIPIVPEAELLQSRPDYLLVLPWHFRSFFETSPRFAGQQLVFPLPELQLVRR